MSTENPNDQETPVPPVNGGALPSKEEPGSDIINSGETQTPDPPQVTTGGGEIVKPEPVVDGDKTLQGLENTNQVPGLKNSSGGETGNVIPPLNPERILDQEQTKKNGDSPDDLRRQRQEYTKFMATLPGSNMSAGSSYNTGGTNVSGDAHFGDTHITNNNTINNYNPENYIQASADFEFENSEEYRVKDPGLYESIAAGLTKRRTIVIRFHETGIENKLYGEICNRLSELSPQPVNARSLGETPDENLFRLFDQMKKWFETPSNKVLILDMLSEEWVSSYCGKRKTYKKIVADHLARHKAYLILMGKFEDAQIRDLREMEVTVLDLMQPENLLKIYYAPERQAAILSQLQRQRSEKKWSENHQEFIDALMGLLTEGLAKFEETLLARDAEDAMLPELMVMPESPRLKAIRLIAAFFKNSTPSEFNALFNLLLPALSAAEAPPVQLPAVIPVPDIKPLNNPAAAPPPAPPKPEGLTDEDLRNAGLRVIQRPGATAPVITFTNPEDQSRTVRQFQSEYSVFLLKMGKQFTLSLKKEWSEPDFDLALRIIEFVFKVTPEFDVQAFLEVWDFHCAARDAQQPEASATHEKRIFHARILCEMILASRASRHSAGMRMGSQKLDELYQTEGDSAFWVGGAMLRYSAFNFLKPYLNYCLSALSEDHFSEQSGAESSNEQKLLAHAINIDNMKNRLGMCQSLLNKFPSDLMKYVNAVRDKLAGGSSGRVTFRLTQPETEARLLRTQAMYKVNSRSSVISTILEPQRLIFLLPIQHLSEKMDLDDQTFDRKYLAEWLSPLIGASSAEIPQMLSTCLWALFSPQITDSWLVETVDNYMSSLDKVDMRAWVSEARSLMAYMKERKCICPVTLEELAENWLEHPDVPSRRKVLYNLVFARLFDLLLFIRAVFIEQFVFFLKPENGFTEDASSEIKQALFTQLFNLSDEVRRQEIIDAMQYLHKVLDTPHPELKLHHRQQIIQRRRALLQLISELNRFFKSQSR